MFRFAVILVLSLLLTAFSECHRHKKSRGGAQPSQPAPVDDRPTRELRKQLRALGEKISEQQDQLNQYEACVLAEKDNCTIGYGAL